MAGILIVDQIQNSSNTNQITFDNSGNFTTGNLICNGTITGGTGLLNIGSGQIYKDTSGNLGLGVTPSGWASGYKVLQVGLSAGLACDSTSSARVYCNTYYDGANLRYINTDFASQYSQYQGAHRWYNAASGTAGNAISFTQAMTLDASGNLLVGKTSSTVAGINQGGIQSGKEIMSCGSVAGIGWENRSGGVTLSSNWYLWYNAAGTNYLYNGGGNIASINGTSGAYTALSDRNKKKDFEASDIGLAAVLKLKPTLFRMIDADTDSPKELGFIAQDVKDIIPQAYVEHELTEDAGGNASTYIGLSDRPIIAVLTKAIQELSAQNKALEERLAKLETK